MGKVHESSTLNLRPKLATRDDCIFIACHRYAIILESPQIESLGKFFFVAVTLTNSRIGFYFTWESFKYRSCHQEVFCKKGLLRNKACNVIKKKTQAQVISCEFCQISKNTFLHGTPLVAASSSIQGTFILQYLDRTTNLHFSNNKRFVIILQVSSNWSRYSRIDQINFLEDSF